MQPGFEQRDADAAGRIGRLSVPRAETVVETPALLPVVNPNVLTVAPARIGDLGAQALITNAYILQGDEDLHDRALEEGVHDLLGFDGVVMTDSGSFQLAEYGEIDVTSEEILQFQRAIGSDVGTPVDLPTPPGADRETVERELETTQERIAAAAEFDAGEMLVTAPVQGGTFPDLRERAARRARAADLDVYPVGAMVPLLNDYRYADVVDAVVAAKRGLGPGEPVHLFGAGHPMTFALAAAAGCDLFDSAAYAIYARDDRYLTVRGTRHLEELDYLPCACPVCTDHDADSLRALDPGERHSALAEHNLQVSFAEIRRIRDAVRTGDLLELVEARARAHPALLDGYRALLEHADWLETHDPAAKSTFRYLSGESAERPELLAHRRRLDRLTTPDELLLTEGARLPAYDHAWRLVPPLGPVPPALSESYPLTAEVPDRLDDRAREAAARGVARLVEANPDTAFALAHRGWPDHALAPVPDGVDRVDLSSRRGPAGDGETDRDRGDRR